MTEMSFPLMHIRKYVPWVRAYMVKAAALAVVAVPLPAHGHDADIPSVAKATTTRIANASPVAVTDYVDLKNAAQAFNVLRNDTDANNDTLNIIEASAQFGAVAFTADGLIAYAANPVAPLHDEIIYVVSDGHGGLAKGKVIVSAG